MHRPRARRQRLARLALTACAASTLGLVGAETALGQDTTFDIVAVGDSFGSGEGSPQRNGVHSDITGFAVNGRVERWGPTRQDLGVPNDPQRCHRSPRVGTEVAARDLARLFPEIRVNYVNFACSGAKILGASPDGGVLNPYKGSEPPFLGDPLPPQLTQAETHVIQRNRREIDALLVAIGVNDVGFATLPDGLMTGCVFNPFIGELNPFDPNCAEDGATNQAFVERLRDLPRKYDTLGQAIRGELPREILGVPVATPNLSRTPSRVYIQEYPNPVRNERRQLCDREGDDALIRRLQREESAFIDDFVLPELNERIADAARRNGWTVVPMGTTFERHGLCAAAEQRFFNNNRDAVVKQGDDVSPIPGPPLLIGGGVAHPNVEGHREVARRVVAALTPQIDGDRRVRRARARAVARARALARARQRAAQRQIRAFLIRTRGTVLTRQQRTRQAELRRKLAQARVVLGVFQAGRRSLSAEPGESATFDLSWTHPSRWRALRSVDLRLRKGGEDLATISVDPVRRQARIAGPNGRFGRPAKLGGNAVLTSPYLRLGLEESFLADSGPTGRSVVMSLDLLPTRRLRGSSAAIDVRATRSRSLAQRYESASTLRVARG